MFDKTGRLILVLMIITMVSAIVLTTSFQVTEPLIMANRLARQEKNIQLVLPGASEFQEREERGLVFFEGFNEEGHLIGLAVARVVPGFSGPISLIIGLSDSFQITGLRVQEMTETPGLGARITEDWFLNQFEGLDRSSSFQEYDSIAGATVSSDAVAGILLETIEEVQRIYQEEGE